MREHWPLLSRPARAGQLCPGAGGFTRGVYRNQPGGLRSCHDGGGRAGGQKVVLPVAGRVAAAPAGCLPVEVAVGRSVGLPLRSGSGPGRRGHAAAGITAAAGRQHHLPDVRQVTGLGGAGDPGLRPETAGGVWAEGPSSAGRPGSWAAGEAIHRDLPAPGGTRGVKVPSGRCHAVRGAYRSKRQLTSPNRPTARLPAGSTPGRHTFVRSRPPGGYRPGSRGRSIGPPGRRGSAAPAITRLRPVPGAVRRPGP